MKVITVINNQGDSGFNLLRLSCSVNNLELSVLLYQGQNFHTNRIKDELLLNFLDKGINDEEIIFFTDGNDAILLCSEDEILRKYHQAGKEIIFSAESSCWPDKELAQQYPIASSAYRYLNSGGFIGKAGIIKQLLKEDFPLDRRFEKSNQYVWAKRYFKHSNLIGLDSACEIFHTFSPEVGERYWPDLLAHNWMPYYSCMKQWFRSNFRIENGRLFSKISGTWPCHAHFNGFSKCIMVPDILNMVFGQIPDRKKARFIDGVTNTTITY